MTNEEKSKLQADIVSSLPERPNGRLLLAPRVGKSKLIIDIIKRDQPNSILWVTPSKTLATVDIPAEFKKWEAEQFLGMLITSTYAGLKNVEGTFDLVVLDEDQHVTEKSVQNFGISKTLHARTILGMTGTSSTNVKKNKIYSRLGFDNVLYTIDIHKAVKFGLVADYKITVVGVPMSKERVARKVWGKMLPMTEPQYYQYLTGLVNNARPKFYKFCVINRMNFIKNSDSKLQAAKDILSILKGRVLIFAASIAQANRVCAHTFNSKTDDTDLNLFRQKKIDKLALVNSGGTGFTYQDLDHLLLIQVDSDSNGITTQKLTRTLLAQGSSYKANIIILYLKGTKDEDWMPRALARFDISKTEHISLEEFKKKYNEDKSEN